MKTRTSVLAIAVMLIGVLATGEAFAQHRRYHHHGPRVSIGIGLGFGVPFAAYPYYAPFYAPYYYPAYYPAPVIVQQQSPVYVEQSQQPAAAGYWYYCGDARAYYPYVKECPGGWQRVAPQPS
jgi:hypothetical protein